MAERYLDVLTIHLRGYTGHPLARNLAEELVLQVAVGARVDVDQLADELKEDVGGGPRVVHQSITERSWGASSLGAELIVDVPAALTGLASPACLVGYDLPSHPASGPGASSRSAEPGPTRTSWAGSKPQPRRRRDQDHRA